jgi:ribosomal protein S18 acetylase RimI-like enzyme
VSARDGAPPAASVAIEPLDPSSDEEAAVILAPATGEGTVERARDVLAEDRRDPDREVYGLTVDGRLIAVYATRQIGLTIELTHIAVAEGDRRKRYGRACLVDALRRAGKRPLVVETDEEILGFYQSAGFKIVSRRKNAHGVVRYRLGLHSPSHYAERSRSV